MSSLSPVPSSDAATRVVLKSSPAASAGPGPLTLAIVNAGVSDPSSTGMLADRLAGAVAELAAASGRELAIRRVELRPLAVDIANAIVSGFPGERLAAAIETLAAADGVIAATPVYKAGPSGLFKSFVDILDNDLLLATPVALVATAGTARHALVADDQMRPLFAYMRSLVAPTSLFASSEDWGAADLADRTDRVARELNALMVTGARRAIRDAGWDGYQHVFGSAAVRAEREASDIRLDTDLMRLATGG